MADDQRRFWWCGGAAGKGHVVGEIACVDLLVEGRTTALMQYEKSMPSPTAEVPVSRGYVVSGFKMSCTICGQMYDWYPSVASLKRLLSRYEVRNG